MALKIKYVKCPTNKYSVKCPYSMTPTRIVVHNTANDASAMNEISYMLSNNNQVSYHYAVDDTQAVQGIALNRNAWHAGDGRNGIGNRYGISIEICYSKSGGDRFAKAEENAAELIATLLKQYKWGINKVTKHQDYSGKKCPHRTIDLGWQRFLNMVQDKLNELNNIKEKQAKPTTTTYKYKVGQVVSINGVYTSSNSTNKLKPSTTKGTITKIYQGAKNPYLLNDGNIGFVNDNCIVANATSSSSSKNTLKVGSKVKLKTSATVYQGSSKGVKIPSSVKGKTYTVKQINGNTILLKEIQSWVLKSECTLV